MSLRFWTILLALAGSAWAGEYVVFTSGARLHVDRHETDGSRMVLYTQGGSSELESSMIARVEPDEVIRPEIQPPSPAAPAPAPALSPLQLADAAAEKYRLPSWLVRAVMAAESGNRPDAVSPKGAVGLMQLMPPTAKALGADPADPTQNVDAGTRYLRDLLEKYNYGLWHALAAYNAGPGAVEKYRGIPPYAETVNYIRRIMRDFKP